MHCYNAVTLRTAILLSTTVIVMMHVAPYLLILGQVSGIR
jgi:hypothetical protein